MLAALISDRWDRKWRISIVAVTIADCVRHDVQDRDHCRLRFFRCDVAADVRVAAIEC
jgi:hypothetical protein